MGFGNTSWIKTRLQQPSAEQEIPRTPIIVVIGINGDLLDNFRKELDAYNARIESRPIEFRHCADDSLHFDRDEVFSNRHGRESTRGKQDIPEHLLLQRKHHTFNQVKQAVTRPNNVKSHKHRTNTQSRQLYGASVVRRK